MTTHEQQRSLSRQLLRARLAAELSQNQVATALQLSVKEVAALESGERLVSTLELSKLAKLFRQPIRSFVFDENLGEPSGRMPDSDSALQQMLDELATREPNAISDDERSAALQLALYAFKSEEISAGKLRDVGALLGISAEELLKLRPNDE
ncbi:Helix-turn-helix domain protein [Pirellula sp. SH-Sr6A]|uniref:helix-turn-helix transcriptional regulator n=1 Tax=Pirellula sp. SH-Sr6A TaxID=1632865 RepID=UPI00078E130B|nr:helix-turn-helix transcriptional regulator [Pirellula sp. SH-Sr6A]AMV35124.1 Helix-turn-helix domain protein [Pirellula sp. SH-Sr6A]